MRESDAGDDNETKMHKFFKAFRDNMGGLGKHPFNLVHVLEQVRQEQLLGHWQGYGEQFLQAGDLLTLLMKQPAHIVPQAVHYRFSLTMHFEVAGSQVVGDGEVHFDLQPLGLAKKQDVYLDITVTFREDGCLKLDLQNIETNHHFAFCEMRLSDDGYTLAGDYYALGLATRYPVSGIMQLHKVT